MISNNQTHNTDDLLLKALSFISAQQNGQSIRSRLGLVRQCAHDLREQFFISFQTAMDIACKALCEFESKQNEGVYVDVNKTTSFCIVVNDPVNNVTRYLSIKDINEMIKRTHFSTIKADESSFIAVS